MFFSLLHNKIKAFLRLKASVEKLNKLRQGKNNVHDGMHIFLTLSFKERFAAATVIISSV